MPQESQSGPDKEPSVPLDSLGLPKILFQSPAEQLIKRFDTLTTFVIGVLLVGFLTMLFMVGGLVIEAWRFHGDLYRDERTAQSQLDLMNEQKKLSASIDDLRSQVQGLKK